MKLTYQEIGALLCAVGEQMMDCGVCAGAVQDGNGDDDLVKTMRKHGIKEDRARELCRVDLLEAVEYVDI